MASVDFHAQCPSYVRISIKDLNGKHGPDLADIQHPDTRTYPGVSVGACQLAAGHSGRCEMFVDGEGGTGGHPYRGHWITWEHRHPNDELQHTYRWDTHPACCQATSATGYHCVRHNDHPDGHAFTLEP